MQISAAFDTINRYLVVYIITIELSEYFPGHIRAWTQIWVHVQVSSSGLLCTKWADNQYSPAGLEPWVVLDLPFP